MLYINNSDKEISETNYWDLEVEKKGFFNLSINAGAFRLLVPQNQEKLIKEFRTGKYCIISKCPSAKPFMFELLFEDHTDNPYCLFLSSGQVWPLPCDEDAGKKYVLSVWTEGCKKVLEMDAYFRVVNKLPYMKKINVLEMKEGTNE